jgi:acyl-CoA thioester hydrolase
MKYFTTTYRVIYGDVDAMKVAYYGNYMRWFEIGRTELIRHLGLPYAEIEARGYILPVSEAYCKYSRSARYDEILLIATGLGFIRRASMRFDYRITDQENGLIAQGFTVHACVDKDGRMIRLPESIVSLLENWR